jgi:hypothetical protein
VKGENRVGKGAAMEIGRSPGLLVGKRLELASAAGTSIAAIHPRFPVQSARPISNVILLGSRFAGRPFEEGSESESNLAVVLDQSQPGGRQLPLARPVRKTGPTPAPEPVQAPRAPTSRAATESDAAWYAKMRGYLGKQSGAANGAGTAAPQHQPRQVETDESWYAKMHRHFDRERAGSPGSDETTAAPAPASPEQPLGGELTVGKHIRDYVIGGEQPVSPRDQGRLDAISVEALAVCERELGPLLSVAARRVLPNLQVSVDLDLSRLSDDEAAEAWGQQLAAVVRSRLRRGIAEIGAASRPE